MLDDLVRRLQSPNVYDQLEDICWAMYNVDPRDVVAALLAS